MKAKIPMMIGAAALAIAPTLASAQTAPPGNGYLNGNNYWHSNGPTTTGQPGAECEDLIEDEEGSFPGHAGDNGSSAFGGSAGDVYAGSQPQNSRNSASSSQYDVGCLHGTPGRRSPQ